MQAALSCLNFLCILMIKLIKLLFNAEAVNLVIFLIVELTDESSGTKLFFPAGLKRSCSG